MPRPLLEIWRELNDGRDGAPSSLLPRKPLSFAEQAANALRPRPRSPTEQAIADIAREMSSPEMREKLRLKQQLSAAVAEVHPRQRLFGVAERVLGKPRPVSPPSLEPASPVQRKREPGAGRKRNLTQEQIDRGIRLLRGQPRMPIEAARATLRGAGIDAGNTTLYDRVIRPAYASR